MNYEWQRDNISWLKLTKQFLKTKQLKKWSEKKLKNWIINDKAEELREANNKIL